MSGNSWFPKNVSSLTHWYFLQVVPSQVEPLEVAQVADLDRQVCDLVAGSIQVHEVLHFANLFWQTDQTIVVQNQTLEARQLTNGGWKVAQLVAAGKKMSKKM